MKALKGHTSPETALVVDDYPYGFRLRCKIRYWIEFKPGKGFRFCSQTSNPKSPTLVWNKPKASTYAKLGGVLVEEDGGIISWLALTEYDQYNVTAPWLERYGEFLPEDGRRHLEHYVKIQKRYEELKAEGVPFQLAARQAVIEINKAEVKDA